MSDERCSSFEEGLAEFYRGEVLGEIGYSALLELAEDPLERLKLAHLLQLETETKAWLRPHMIGAGLSIAEPASWRELAQRMIDGFAPLDWTQKMSALAAFIPDVAKQYGAYAEAARDRADAAQAAVCDFMVDHELAQLEFFKLELDGAEPMTSLKPLMRQSRYPLPVSN